MALAEISTHTLRRLPLYLHYLRSLGDDMPQSISATAIAAALGLNHVQVRKDLAAVSGSGKPRIGYSARGLCREIEIFLGYDNVRDAVLVGAGRLGRALLGFGGFQALGLNIVCAFDEAEAAWGRDGSGKQVYPMGRMADLMGRMKILIGIIATPAEAAQAVCDQLVRAGALAVWNFAPVQLTAPSGVLIQTENMAASLAVLSNHLAARVLAEENIGRGGAHEAEESV